MPINLKQNTFKYKDPTTGTYKSVDTIGEAITFDAEAFAKGTRNNVLITDINDPAYQKNAKYYADQAAAASTSATELVGAAAGAVRFDTEQQLTAAQQEQVRQNIGGASAEQVNDLKDDLNYSKTATSGNFLRATTRGHGTEWVPIGTPTDAQTEQAVRDWLDDHPEATTTVQDGAITEAKLHNDVKAKLVEDGSITEQKLANDVKGKLVEDGSITEDKIADGSITEDKLANDVIEKLDSASSEFPGTLSLDVLYNKINYDNYCIFQGGCYCNRNLVIAHSNTSDNGNIKLREISLSDFSVVREQVLALGHANGLTSDGTNIYVASAKSGSDAKIHVVKYSDFSLTSSISQSDLPVSVCINGVGNLVCLYPGLVMKEYSLPGMTLVNTWTWETQLKHGALGADIDYYGGRYYMLLSGPNTLYISDESGNLVKIINVPERLERATLMETEFIASNGHGKFYIGWNTPLSPYTTGCFENIITVSDFKTGDSNNNEQNISQDYSPNRTVGVTVDIGYTGYYSDGSAAYPYKELQQAINDVNTPNSTLWISIADGEYDAVYVTNKHVEISAKNGDSSCSGIIINGVYVISGVCLLYAAKLKNNSAIGYAAKVEKGGLLAVSTAQSNVGNIRVTTGGMLYSGAYMNNVSLGYWGTYCPNTSTIRDTNVSKNGGGAKILGRRNLINKSSGFIGKQTIPENHKYYAFIEVAVAGPDQKWFTGTLSHIQSTVIPILYYKNGKIYHGNFVFTITSDTEITTSYEMYETTMSGVTTQVNTNPFLWLMIDGVL